jgi:ubiquinone/menaquinone biosynthesis C-methylase UbiE
MAHGVCPWWLGYWLVNPLRRLWESPVKLLGPFVRESMTVLEPGCGMGYFTLDVARMVGPAGRVVAVDLQERMLAGLRRRAARAGLLERIEIRQARPDGLCLGDLAGRVDLALALHMVHEVPDPAAFLGELREALAPGGALVIVEPRGHVSAADFTATLAVAAGQGFDLDERVKVRADRAALLRRVG